MTYGRKNYILIGLSIAIIVIGFVLMSGGGSEDPNVFNPEIFSTRRIVIAPAVCLAGFLLMIVAILIKPDAGQED
ncbi:MAG: DUF3098 domain-containing protein [Porphyromonadaceae bacterium]|nr:DUF3098 domain-containing protein [Porphyromonadaceae bacterium]